MLFHSEERRHWYVFVSFWSHLFCEVWWPGVYSHHRRQIQLLIYCEHIRYNSLLNASFGCNDYSFESGSRLLLKLAVHFHLVSFSVSLSMEANADYRSRFLCSNFKISPKISPAYKFQSPQTSRYISIRLVCYY